MKELWDELALANRVQSAMCGEKDAREVEKIIAQKHERGAIIVVQRVAIGLLLVVVVLLMVYR